MEKTATINTNLGNLIVALTEEATPLVHNQQEAYEVVALILTRLLRNRIEPARARRYRHESIPQ